MSALIRAFAFAICATAGCVGAPRIDAGSDADVPLAPDAPDVANVADGADRDQPTVAVDSFTADQSDTFVACAAPLVSCNGLCVALQTNAAHCGGCNRRCGPRESCSDGRCVATCAAPHIACGQECADLLTDRNNCGMCGSVCSAGQVCTNGACSCPDATPNACGMGAATTCVNFQTDALNCGACAQACAVDQHCLRGVGAMGAMGCGACAGTNIVCGMGATRRCVSPESSQHCGRCDNACGSNGTCTAGVCAPQNASPGMAIPLAVVLNGARVTTTGNNQGSAAMDPAQCAPRAVYYSVTVTAPAILYVDTFGSSFDTHVGVRLQGTMATVGCNDNSCGGMQSQTTMVVPIGTHLIEVSGSAGALSTFVLNVAAIAASNGGRNEVVAPDSSRRWVRGNTAAMANLPIDVPAEVPVVGARAADVHYYVTCPTEPARTLHVSTCESAFDTVLSVLHGGGVGRPTITTDDDGGDVACNTAGAHDSNISGARVPPGAGIHAMYVTGKANATGLYTLHYSLGCANNHVDVAMRCLPVQTLQTDARSCGSAGRVCPAGHDCTTGVCVAPGENADPPALTFAVTETLGRELTAIGAPMGGTPFSERCPAGQVLIGVQSSESVGGAATQIVGHIAGICADLGAIGRTATSPQRVSFSRVMGTLPAHGAAGAARLRPRELLCPDGHALVGISAAADRTFVHSLALQCAPITVTESGAGPFVLTFGTPVLIGAVGGEGGEGAAFMRSTQMCAANEVVNGLSGQTDQGVLAVGVRCTSPRVLQLQLNLADTSSPGIVGGNGGFAFTTPCPVGSVLSGVNIGATDRLGGALTRLRATCRRITGFTSVSPFFLATGTSAPTGIPQGSALAPATNVECAAGHLPVAFNGASDMRSGYATGIRFRCASIRHTPPMTTDPVPAPETPEIVAAPNAISARLLSCPPNTLPTGIHGRAGAIVDQFGLRCTRFAIR